MAKKKVVKPVSVVKAVEITPVEDHEINPKKKPMTLQELGKEFDLGPTPVKAEDIINVPISITKWDRFPSSQPNQEYAYFVTATEVETGEVLTVVIGGKQPIELLDTLTEQKVDRAVLVTLIKVEGGNHGWYYILR